MNGEQLQTKRLSFGKNDMNNQDPLNKYNLRTEKNTININLFYLPKLN